MTPTRDARSGTARNAAREAISLLQGESLVIAQHGRGVVRPRTPLMRLGVNRYSPRLRADEVTGLATPPGAPVIQVLHTSLDDSHRPIEVTRFVMRGDLNGLDDEMPVED